MSQLIQSTGLARAVVLVPITTFSAAATTNGTEIDVDTGFKSARFYLKADAGVGTSPTLNVYIQSGILRAGASDVAGDKPTGAVAWTDICSFTQATTGATEQIFTIYPNTSANFAVTNATLAAASNQNGPIGRIFRAVVKVGGTSPQFANLQVTAEFLPW